MTETPEKNPLEDSPFEYRKYKNGKRNVGWIDKYNWRDELSDNGQGTSDKGSEHLTASSPKGTNNIARGKGVTSVPPTAGRQPPADFPAWLKRTSSRMTWHWPYQQLIYDKLQAVTDGTCKRLMIFLPPRHGKSELVTVRYSAWRLQQDPTLNIILGSYNQRLANRFSRKVRIALEDALQLIENGELRIDNENASVSSPHVPGSPPQHPRAGWQSNGSAKEIEQQTAESDDRSKLTSSNSQLSILNSPLPSLRRRLNTVAEWETGLAVGSVRSVSAEASPASEQIS
jgi:hypothetical protein